MAIEKSIRARVRGNVQGVGFRFSTVRVARELGIAGWVRNRADGSVEVRAQGDVAALARFEAFLRQGPRGAIVRAVEILEEDSDPSLTDFSTKF